MDPNPVPINHFEHTLNKPNSLQWGCSRENFEFTDHAANLQPSGKVSLGELSSPGCIPAPVAAQLSPRVGLEDHATILRTHKQLIAHIWTALKHSPKSVSSCKVLAAPNRILDPNLPPHAMAKLTPRDSNTNVIQTFKKPMDMIQILLVRGNWMGSSMEILPSTGKPTILEDAPWLSARYPVVLGYLRDITDKHRNVTTRDKSFFQKSKVFVGFQYISRNK